MINQVKSNGPVRTHNTIEIKDGNNKTKETRINILENNRTIKTSGNSKMMQNTHNIQENNRMKTDIHGNNNTKRMITILNTHANLKTCMISILENLSIKKLLNTNVIRNMNTRVSSSLSSNTRDIRDNNMSGSTMITRTDSIKQNPNHQRKDHWLVQDHSHLSSILATLQVEDHKLLFDLNCITIIFLQQ